MLCLSDSIRHDDPAVQPLLSTIEKAQTLAQLILAVWPLARVLALHIIEHVLAERAQRPIAWPPCPCCGARCAVRALPHASSRVCLGLSAGDAASDGVPTDVTSRRSPLSMRSWGCSRISGRAGNSRRWAVRFAVFVPFATAARLLGWYCGGVVSPRAVWCWVQAAGHQAMALLQDELAAVGTGDEPTPEPLTAEQAALPLALGADGVMVPFRPEGGTPRGKIRWREVKVGVLARLGQHRTRTGQVVTRLTQRRLVAVLGDIDALTAASVA